MSVPPSSSNNISDNNKLGGASPSPIEGIEGLPGPSSLDPMHSVLPQDEESEDYGDDEDEDEDETSEGESEISDSGLFCDTECTAEVESNNCQSPVSQSQAVFFEQGQSPVSHNCVPSDVIQSQRKRKSETEYCLPCKKLNPEEKPHTIVARKLDDKSKHVRSVIPTKDNPPPEMSSWLLQFQRWSNAERMLAIDELIERCEPTQVRHMMQVIEPQFQRDFISLLPKELALSVLAFLEPKDLLRAAQTCRNWRFLADDNLLWKEKCKAAGIEDLKDLPPPKRKNCRSGSNYSSSPWKQAYMRQHNIKMNWRMKPIREPKVLKGHDDHVITCLQFSGNRIVSGSDDNTLKVWSAVSGKCLRTLVGHTGGVWSSQMSGTIVISGSTDRTLKVWNAETGQCIHTLYGHTSTVRCMHLHGNKVVSGSRDATLRVWQIDTGECLHVLVGHLAAVRCVQYDGRLVVSGAYDYLVKVWNPEREECLHTLHGHTNRVYSLQFDGVHVVSGSLDTSIRVWEVETGACRHTLMGHQSLTSGMELRNNILVSGNADSTVKVWDIVSGHCLQTLSGPNKHQSAVTCLQFNSHFVITSSDDGTVKLWDVNTGDFIRNLIALESGGSGGVVWRIRASDTKLVCAVGSRNGTEETKLLVLDFDVEEHLSTMADENEATET
ncbi:F-box/WD repeat-containing protein 7 [Pseudomyrmex gracilis]|uniref:F-box/WD repeat-containing protein 7 n=1 Tax=Pseudomyrmex gracilis TaxID=219809 RepID=UPI0009952173|nr:F-box/WD repeat-containing protein 7 [Pseudomyrmex gracilis]XP_020293655.1 F-box/WD repeat-containing protein 7 [Pseudomyrmex gracilis]XP_020293656.1 F-box/WD repeat-containing protein 7 [Pseudomyrmex gracilis]XP_020293657.1 F-box/WD repeat-containing protein 7 [Pseudomyrmex gracilis]XP_020293658.1 F-box/WD repeat-containing protein 7 [Pseudomyrmex gracilis]